MKPGTFLTAEWRNLAMFNYAVNPALLEPFVPRCTEIDFFQGQTFLSLIGFEFNRTRIAGVAVPFHRSFEEVNLRFYVRRAERRGVVFLRELVPKRAVAAVARFAFGENYICVPMSHRLHLRHDEVVESEYRWGSGSSQCSMRIETGETGFLPTDGSLAQFITEHYWGYSAQTDGGSLEYEVRHPKWTVRTAKLAEFSGRAERFYGEEFAAILAKRPDSAFLAAGSPVTVFRGTRIESNQIPAEMAH